MCVRACVCAWCVCVVCVCVLVVVVVVVVVAVVVAVAMGVCGVCGVCGAPPHGVTVLRRDPRSAASRGSLQAPRLCNINPPQKLED